MASAEKLKPAPARAAAPAAAKAAVSPMTKVREGSQLVLLLSISVVVLAIALTISLIFVTRKHHEVIAATDQGRIIPVVPLDIPYVSDARVVGFVNECAMATFDHDFMHWRTTLTDARKCYTSTGGDNMAAALDPWIKDIREREMTMTVSMTDTPVIVKRAPDRGLYSWKVQAPITLFRRGTRVVAPPQPQMLEVIVRRVGLDENPRGIAIDSIVLTPDTNRSGG